MNVVGHKPGEILSTTALPSITPGIVIPYNVAYGGKAKVPSYTNTDGIASLISVGLSRGSTTTLPSIMKISSFFMNFSSKCRSQICKRVPK